MKKAIVALMAVAVTLSFATMAAAESAGDTTLEGGETTSEDLTEERETVNWALVYGTVDETVSLSDEIGGEETEVFSWDEAESAADGSAVLAVDSDADVEDRNAVDDGNQAEVDGVPRDGADSFDNTYDFAGDADSPAALGVDTAAASSESTDFSGDNLFVYANEEENADGNLELTNPVWAGLVENEAAVDNSDYEVLVGEDDAQFSTNYDLYVELEDQ